MEVGQKYFVRDGRLSIVVTSSEMGFSGSLIEKGIFVENEIERKDLNYAWGVSKKMEKSDAETAVKVNAAATRVAVEANAAARSFVDRIYDTTTTTAKVGWRNLLHSVGAEKTKTDAGWRRRNDDRSLAGVPNDAVVVAKQSADSVPVGKEAIANH